MLRQTAAELGAVGRSEILPTSNRASAQPRECLMGGRGRWSSAWYGRSRPKSNDSGRIVAEAIAPPLPTGFIVPQLDQSMFSSTVQTPTPSNNTDLALNISISNNAADAPSVDSGSPPE